MFPYTAPQLDLGEYKKLKDELQETYGTNFDIRGRDSGQPRRAVRAGGPRRAWLTIFGPHVETAVRFLEELCEKAGLDLARWRKPIIHRQAGSEAYPQPDPQAAKPSNDEEDEEGQPSDDEEDESDYEDDKPPPPEGGQGEALPPAGT